MSRTKPEKLWIGGGAAAAALLAGGIWMFGVSPQLSDADSLRGQAADTQTQNMVLQSKVDSLQQQFAHIGGVRKQLAAARKQLPTDSGLSPLTNQLQAQARSSHVTITQLSFGSPAAVQSAAPATPVPTPSSSSAAASPSSTTTTTTTTTVGTSTSGGAPGLYSIPVTMAFSGSSASELAFVRAVQQTGPRVALVSTVSVAQDSSTGGTTPGGASTMNLQAQVFVALQGAAATPTPTSTLTAGG